MKNLTQMLGATHLIPPDQQPIVVLLVDDQAIVAKAVESMFEDQEDISFHFCGDATKAVEMAIALKPTVILQDLLMPDIDGLTMVRYFRANPATKNTPIVVLSSKEDPETKMRSFAYGANDYMVKLPDKLEVIARVRYHSTAYITLQQRNVAFEALKKELSDAAEYVRSLLPEPRAEAPKSDWIYLPSAGLGGDAFGHHWIDDDHFAVYLLDVCGHGVGAALLSVSVMNVFRAQSLADTDFKDPSMVLERLNTAFQMEKHNNMFFTIWYGVFNKTSRELTYSSGGHPPAALVTRNNGAWELNTLSTPGFLIGAMPESRYEKASCTVAADSSLFVFSDGTYEIKKASDGSMMSINEWNELLVQTQRDQTEDLSQLLSHMRTLQDNDEFEDDFSLLRICF